MPTTLVPIQKRQQMASQVLTSRSWYWQLPNRIIMTQSRRFSKKSREFILALEKNASNGSKIMRQLPGKIIGAIAIKLVICQRHLMTKCGIGIEANTTTLCQHGNNSKVILPKVSNLEILNTLFAE